MKRILMTIAAMAIIAMNAQAMSYSQARAQALYLTDKMAYELYLSDDQYNACYEINLDYLMCVEFQSDIFGYYWDRRNLEFEYVLSRSQYALYMTLEYFYRPISWYAGKFYFNIYDRYYSKRFFRPAPTVYVTYKGGNRFYMQSPYKGRTFNGRDNVPHDRSNSSWRNQGPGKKPNSGNHSNKQTSFGNGTKATTNHSQPSNNTSFGNQRQGNNSSMGNTPPTQPTIKKNEAIRQSKNSNGDSWKFGAKR
ncbi:MAG: hypothetical protein J5867_08120 [Prevotella sp.]|nr:hypothetical protein [Prevotella sp.]